MARPPTIPVTVYCCVCAGPPCVTISVADAGLIDSESGWVKVLPPAPAPAAPPVPAAPVGPTPATPPAPVIVGRVAASLHAGVATINRASTRVFVGMDLPP